ncbi:zinc finger protein 397 isoform X4 [Plutella xylostella]|uniref:zinc finger protein 397 isoform X4 n=1 Tax=Plutella xylostella TaxID=51655 RepID=UPI0020322BFC|nr:zinc finger protein 397 isoform X4 [Plutella xylostella]
MESFLISGICRCCASEGPSKNLINKYKWMGEEEVYSEMLKDCFDVTLHSTDDPATNGGICEVCITQLRNAYNFKKQVIVTEEFFKRRLLDGEHTFTADIKLEVDRGDCSASENDIDAADDLDSEMSVKSEQDEEKPKRRKVTARASTSRAAKKVKAEDAKSTPRQDNKSTSKTTLPKSVVGKEENANSRLPKVRKTKSGKYDLRVKSKNISIHPIISDIKVKRAKMFENVQTVLLYSNASLIKCKGLDGYSCVVCPAKFPESVDLKKHFLNQHSNPKDIKTYQKKFFLFQSSAKLDISFLNCSVCDTDIDSLEDLMAHLQTKHQKKFHEDVKNIMLPFKFEQPGYHCAVCDYEYGDFKKIVAHMHSHYRNYVCDECDAGFVSEFTLLKHLTRHGGECVCPQCKKTFATSSSLVRHRRQVHGRVKETQCELCPETFRSFDQKLLHLEEIHGMEQKRVGCEFCKRVYESRANLVKHIRRCHMTDHKYKCEYCDRTFCIKAEMNSHRLVHVAEPNAFKCDVCSKAFKLKKSLTQHLRMHTEFLTHKCELCDKLFTGQVGLNYHMKKSHYQMGEFGDDDNHSV